METIEAQRTTKKPAEDLHFCHCGKPADMSCTDAEQTIVRESWDDARMHLDLPPQEIWTETHPRYGCRSHPVESMITFADGRTITAKEYERASR